MVLFKGFSTKQKGRRTLTDVELVKQDLLNAFNTRKGERPMNAEFGTIIWDAIFDPLDDGTREAIQEDITNIVAADPRVQLLGLQLDEYEHGIQFEVELYYRNLDSSEVLYVEFSRNSLNATVS